jgi:hypothetical protein
LAAQAAETSPHTLTGNVGFASDYRFRGISQTFEDPAIQGGFDYADTAVMFRRLADGSFELIVTPWDSDLARSWRQASAQKQTLFRLGTIATNRIVGLL